MFKPSPVLSRILSLLLLPPAATASSFTQLTKDPATTFAAYASSAPVAADANEDDHKDRDASQSLRIVTPTPAQMITGETAVRAIVKVGKGLYPNSLRVTLNGKNVTRYAREEKCGPNSCRWTVELTKANRLLSGQNQLVAFARGSDRSIKIARTNFGYYPGVQQGADKPQWLPPAVGLSLNSGGAQPWVTLTTGWPANEQDSLDPTQYSLPYRDTTFPSNSDTPCSSRYQVVLLNRQNPAQEDGYICAPDSATLKSDLAGLTKGAEIVLVGTTEYQNADAGLDTTSIGGTNYSSPNSWQPLGYAAIGVSGAAPGSAYESYYVASDVGKAYQRNPFANGLLAVDANNNYNFHAGNNMQFEVYPNSPSAGGNSVVVTSSTPSPGNSTVYTWYPPYASANGFWLVLLDRVTLLPIDYSSQGSCYPGISICGQFFPTGNTDTSVASKAVSDLAFALEAPTSRQLVILTTMGQPFQTAAAAGSLLASLAMKWLGASTYTLQSLTTSTSTYTLVAPGPQTSPIFSTEIPTKSPFSRGVVNSSSAFSQQGQTGFVRGVMARDNNSLYFPSVVSQEDGNPNSNAAPTLSIDYDFYTISTQTPIDWPLTDTAGHVAAYHWASHKFLCDHYNTVGGVCIVDPLGQDLRYWYHTPGRNSDIAQYNTEFQCTSNPPSTSPCAYPGDGLGFTQQDLADVDADLYNELTALHDSDLYLGSNGIGGLVTGANSLAEGAISATYEVLQNQVMPVQASTSVNASAFDWMNLFAGVTSVAAAALGPLEVPVAGALVGVTSGALWTGSAVQPFGGNGTSPDTPPSYESVFDATLGQMQEQAEVYSENLANSYGTTLDNLYSDWGKLSATGAKTADSSTGWYFNNEVSRAGMLETLQDGVQRSLYLQLLPRFYSLDTYTQQPVSTLDKVGMFYSWDRPGFFWVNSCTASYDSTVLSNNNLYRVFPSAFDSTKTDMFVMGGSIAYQGSTNATESFPSDSLQAILFGSGDGDLNIPEGLVYGSYALPWRANGPSLGTYDGVYRCYKPGCQDETDSSSQSSCIKP